VGWTIAKDDDGDTYYIDHNEGIVTYDDPRLEPAAEEENIAIRHRIAEELVRSLFSALPFVTMNNFPGSLLRYSCDRSKRETYTRPRILFGRCL
jgi:hypothetical protein